MASVGNSAPGGSVGHALFFIMTNLDLHNKLLEIAKTVSKMQEDNPQLVGTLAPIEHLLADIETVAPSHRPIPRPYRKS
jgi:hypothetical protein